MLTKRSLSEFSPTSKSKAVYKVSENRPNLSLGLTLLKYDLAYALNLEFEYISLRRLRSEDL